MATRGQQSHFGDDSSAVLSVDLLKRKRPVRPGLERHISLLTKQSRTSQITMAGVYPDCEETTQP